MAGAASEQRLPGSGDRCTTCSSSDGGSDSTHSSDHDSNNIKGSHLLFTLHVPGVVLKTTRISILTLMLLTALDR